MMLEWIIVMLIIPPMQPMCPNISLPSARCNELNSLGQSIKLRPTPLLVGVALENKSQIQSIPLTSSPTILCKEHDTKYVNFVSLTEYSSSDGKWVEGGSSTTLRLRIRADQIWASQCVEFILRWGAGGAIWAATRTRKRRWQLIQ